MQQDTPRDQTFVRDRRLRRALAWLRAGRADLALPIFRQMQDSRPGDPLVSLSLATALMRTGETGAALEAFERLLISHPGHTGALHGRGLCLHMAGDLQGALDAFRTALATDPHAWRVWRSIADITPHEDERIHAIEGAADALLVLCQEASPPAGLLAELATALIEARRPARALRALQAHAGLNGEDGTLIRARARALYHGGAYEAAFREAARLLRRLETSQPAEARCSRFEPAPATEALIGIRDLLAAAGVECFLMAGTLLGFHRDGGLLPHDRDVDIGVFRTPDGGPDIAGILRSAPGILLPRIARPGDRYFGLRHKGVAIDIFLHDRAGSHVLAGFSPMPGDIQWRFTGFGLAPARYAGQDWTVPSDPDRYLAESYGPGWQTPDPRFASAVSSPALFGVSPHACAYYAVMRAIRALTTGDTAKAAALIANSPVPLAADDTQTTD